MNMREAKETIAAYLAGACVSSDRVREAWEVARADADGVERLEAALGLGPDWVSECEVFRENLAEFSEMGQPQRDRQLPELVEHLGRCAACRTAYREFMPVWVTQREAIDPSGAVTLHRQLAEAIGLSVSAEGYLRDRGTGPVPLSATPLASAAEAADAGPEPSAFLARKEWLLADEQAGCALRLVICGHRGGKLRASFALESIQPGASPPENAFLEIRDAQTNALRHSGGLVQGRMDDVALRREPLSIRIEAAPGGRKVAWTVLLDLASEQGRQD